MSSPSPDARWPASLEAFAPAPELAPETIRLAFNESPLGPFPAALEALAAHLATQAGRYPEADGRLIERLAAKHHLPEETIVLGNGGDAIIGYVSAAYLRPGDEVLTAWPSFPTYLIDAAKQGATIVTVPLRNGAFDLEAMAQRIGERTRVVWVCTPNNPTGGVVDPTDLRAFLDAVPERVLVVIDEAYHEFSAGRPGSEVVDAVAEHVRSRPNVAALRTFSKLFGLAGMRVGWLAAPAPVAAAVAKARHYYDITGLSALAAIASVGDEAEIARRRELNAQRRARLEVGLTELGRPWLPSEANFVAVDVGDADAVSARLLEHGVATRSLAALGTPDLLRVTVGDDAQVDRLLELLGGSRH
ncbi:MAG TPA: histidinol-phosphate transaminase [Solirubrobacteraceae bacterium]|nr:histidinol-phosphate transaminase [Solirubrobacteraceae bacterium]